MKKRKRETRGVKRKKRYKNDQERKQQCLCPTGQMQASIVLPSRKKETSISRYPSQSGAKLDTK